MAAEKHYTTLLLDKLGVKPGMQVGVQAVTDQDFLTELRERADVDIELARAELDIILFGAEAADELEQLAPLRARIRRNGAIWVIYPKGVKHITQRDVMEAAKAASLVDVKVASFSTTHTGLKLVIPVALR